MEKQGVLSMKNKDEFKSCRFYGDDYTIKTYQKEDCRYYAVVLYETDDDAKVIYTSKAQPTSLKANNLAIEHIKKHKELTINQK